MKRCLSAFLALLLLLPALTGCGGGKTSFTARVIGTRECNLLLEVEDGENSGLRPMARVEVMLPTGTGFSLGDTVRVCSRGEILETAPARLGQVKSVTVLDRTDG